MAWVQDELTQQYYNTETGESTSTPPPGGTTDFASLYQPLIGKYQAMGYDPSTAANMAAWEAMGYTGAQTGSFGQSTPTSQITAAGLDPSGKPIALQTTGQHDPGTAQERALMAALAIGGGAYFAPAAGGGAAAGASGAGLEAAVAEGLSTAAPFTGAGAGGTAGTFTGGAAAAGGATGLSALAEPFGGVDNAAIEGADFSGAADAGLSAGALGGGALGASSLAASGGSAALGGGGSSGGGGSATGGGLMDDWLTEDWQRALLRGAPGLLGALGAASQAEDYEDLAHQYSQMGAPYRSRLESLYSNPEGFLNSPEVRLPIQQGTDMLARSLSVKGNPAGSGNALQELQNYTSNQLFSRLGQEKDRLGGFGGLTQYNQAAPNMAANTINAQGNIYGSLGGAAADIFNPQRRYTLQDLLGY